VSDEIVVMRNAGIAQIGTPRQLYDAPADRFVADFIGEANIIPCEITSVDGDAASITIADFHHTLPARGLKAGPALLAVRPTRLILNAPTGIEVSVKKATYVGSRMEYELEAQFGTLFSVSENVDAPLEIGSTITVGLDAIGPVLLPAD
jgi:iron(III) transport system ATP-binding protein